MKVKKGKEESLKEILLNHLGVSSTDEINSWFRAYYEDQYHIGKLDEVKRAIDQFKDKEIHIIGDYDVDGVTSTAIMYMGLKRYGCKKVFYRTPKRFSEGFGLNKTMIEEIPDSDSLIITVDNGIAAADAVSYAKKRGFTVIVTDHHLPAVDDKGNTILPEADIIIDPSAFPETADYSGYCGAGIAYKIIRYLIGDEARAYFEPIAAIGTIADVMELRKENYAIVKCGLGSMSKTVNIGLNALLEKLNKPEKISADYIGFQVGPCLNAPGRLIDDGSMKSVELLISENKEDAERLSNFIVEQNKMRKELLETATKTAMDIIKKEKTSSDIPIVVNVPDVNEGIIGIVASRVMDTFNRPAIVFTEVEGGMLKGSARSPEESYNVKHVLDRIQPTMVRYGGHAGAAGITIRQSDLPLFRTEVIRSSTEETFEPSAGKDVTYDIEIPVAQAEEAAELIDQFSPHGQGNEKVIVKIPDFLNIPKNGIYKTPAGPEGIKLYGEGITAINFHAAEDFREYEKPEKIVFYGELSFNYFKGNRTVQMNFCDFDMVSTINDSPNPTPFLDILATMAAMRN